MEEYINDIKDVHDYLVLSKYKNIPNLSSKRELINYIFITRAVDLPLNIKEKHDRLLSYELNQEMKKAPEIQYMRYNNLLLCKGDITLLNVECIVNAANSQGLGCFSYGHKCIDNQIHVKAGPQLRVECDRILKSNNLTEIETGKAIITKSYNLRCKYIIHTVGPIYDDDKNKITVHYCNQKLKEAYESCLDLAQANKVKSIAFCCISTGLYGFPKNKACEIAIKTVRDWLAQNPKCSFQVIFCTYSDEDYAIYKNHM